MAVWQVAGVFKPSAQPAAARRAAPCRGKRRGRRSGRGGDGRTGPPNASRSSASASALDAHSSTNGKPEQKKLNPGEAELWQINMFFQREKELQPNTELILHANRINYKRADGANVEKIRFYVRPKIEKGFFAFFDNLINQKKNWTPKIWPIARWLTLPKRIRPLLT